MKKKLSAIVFVFVFVFVRSYAQISPNGKIRAEYVAGKGLVVSYNQGKTCPEQGRGEWQEVMSMPMKEVKASKPMTVNVEYDMLLGKTSHCSNVYNESKYSNGFVVRVYNDGVAWTGAHDYTVNFSTSKNNWLQEWRDSYENFFPQNREQKQNAHYAYPALFEYNNGVFSLLSESCMKRDNAATSMYYADNMTFSLKPDGKEDGGWQTLIIGSLADIVESTLITDNSEPQYLTPNLSTLSYIKPGIAAWVYWAYNHGSNDYNIIKKYTDMAVKMKLPYVLIDAEWDNFLPPYTVEDAVKYAVDNGVSPIIWYSSSIGWIDGAPTPMFRLNKPEDREREFAWCEKIGIKGVKIDFFDGDANKNIRFMVELLESAAKHHLLVNFHGSTAPRGWQRTYPNLVSTEAVYGEEWYNNKPVMTNKAACHNATLPFTRNVIGSMDYTPCAFTDSQHPHITTHAHELALTALFESGIQHLADRPESFLAQPQEVQDYLTNLPTAWDETRLLAGYPGDYVVLARRKGNSWYIAGINGTDTIKTVKIPTSRLKNLGTSIQSFEDSGDVSHPWKIEKRRSIPAELTLQPRGGLILIIR